MAHAHERFGVFSQVVEPNNGDIVKYMTSWIVTGAQITRKPSVISFTVPHSICLLEISDVVGTISPP